MRKLLIFLLVLVIVQSKAQNTGLNFQGVARNSNGVILASQKIALKFSIINLSENGSVEYSEIRNVNTNSQGIFSIVIGDTAVISTVGNFAGINWKDSPKYLKVEMDPNAGNSFVNIGTTQLQKVPFAYYANGVNATNIDGILPIASGGTGVNNLASLKSSLSLNFVNNTSDINKPISAATQTALDLKANSSDVLAGLSLKANSTDVNTALGAKANISDLTNGLSLKVDKVTGKDLSSNDFTSAEKLKLATITGTNTGDQDLSPYATISALSLKANATDVNTALSTKANTFDVTNALNLKADITDMNSTLALKANITDVTSSLLLKANTSDVSTSLSTKVDKVAGKDLSTNDFTSDEKSKLASITGTNTGDQDLSPHATLTALALKANEANVVSRLNDKLNTLDTTFLLQKNDTITLSNRIDLKADMVDLNNYAVINGDNTFSGQQSFLSDMTIGSISGNNTHTMINYANGCKIGDVYGATFGNPTMPASIDLYAPEGQDNYVQLNYNNSNFFWLDRYGGNISNDEYYWNFSNNGSTNLPGDLNFTNDYGSVILSNNYLNIVSFDDLSLEYLNNNLYTGLTFSDYGANLNIKAPWDNSIEWDWNFNNIDGSTDFPGDITLNNEEIARIKSFGDLKISSRKELEIKSKKDLSITSEKELEIKSKHGFKLENKNEETNTSLTFSKRGAELTISDQDGDEDDDSNKWRFRKDGTTHLPGKLIVPQTAFDDFGLTITSPSPEKPLIQDPDKLGSIIGLISNVNSGTTSNTAFIQLNPQGDMVFRTLQHGMLFQNYGNGDFEFKFKIPEDQTDPDNIIPEYTKTTMSINNDNVHIDGSLTIGNTNFPKLSGTAGQVLTMDNDGMNAIWITPSNTISSTSNFTSINGVATGTQSLTTGNYGTDFSILSDVSTGVHTFNLPDASTINRGLLTSSDYSRFYNKQNALTNPLTGSGLNVSGEIPFFNGTNTTTSDPNLFWDAANKRLGISTQSPGYPIEINTGGAKYGLMISSESTNPWGSGIGFKSSTDAATKTGLFQLDNDGAMVFRTLQDNMYFDNAGTGSMIFRMGNPNSNVGMSLNNNGNLEVSGTLKTGSVLYPKVVGNNGDVLTFDSQTNKAIWQAPVITNSTVNVEASTLSGTTLNSTIINSSLKSVGILDNATVNGKLIVGSTSETSSSAIFETSSTSKGFLPPRMSFYQRNQIESPVAGLTIWCNNCGLYGEMQVFNGGAWTNMIGGSATSPITLAIGDSYQGGKVAYILQSGDPGYDANTQHGIIAATSDQSSRIMWYNGITSNTGATAIEIGAGLSNTKLIISNQGPIITDYAAGVARSYNGGGYKDWYLPSKGELKKLYQNRVAIGGFSDISYWSSSEIDESRAVLYDFWDGLDHNFDKFATALVRAVRSF